MIEMKLVFLIMKLFDVYLIMKSFNLVVSN